MNILVSACLMGYHCRYDGAVRPIHPSIDILAKGNDTLFPFCPEIAAGLGCPRMRTECRGNMVVTEALDDVTGYFELGAQRALEVATEHRCAIAILKEHSPSCGCGLIYDGTFSGTLIEGKGVTARRLVQAGIFVLGESSLEGHFNRNNPKFRNDTKVGNTHIIRGNHLL